MRSLLLVVAALVLSGCHWASGTLHYEGSDPVGHFSGGTGATWCGGAFTQNGHLDVRMDGSARGHVVQFDGTDPQAVMVGAPGALWILRREECAQFDVGASAEGGQVHAFVHIDCVSSEGVHVWGALDGSECSLRRP